MLTPQEQAQKLREQGIPEELIKQLLSLGGDDPSHLAKQYEQGSFLRRAATSGDYAKTGAGALAQGIAGYMVGKKDKEYADAVRGYQGKATNIRSKWFAERYPRQITPLPQMPVRQTRDEEYNLDL